MASQQQQKSQPQQQQQEKLMVPFDKAGLPDFRHDANRRKWQQGLVEPTSGLQNYKPNNTTKLPPPVNQIMTDMGVGGVHSEVMHSFPSAPSDEYVYVFIDFETVCWRVWYNAGGYVAAPSEVGIAWVDPYEIWLRQSEKPRGKGGPSLPGSSGGAGNPEPRQQQGGLGSIGPGDRGENWARYMKKAHAIVEERWTHQKETCTSPWHKKILASGGPASFAFGKSVVVKEARLKEFIEGKFDLARRPPYITEKIKGSAARRDWYAKRKIRLMAWDVGLEKTMLGFLGVDPKNIQLYDLQQHPGVLGFFGGKQANAGNFLASLGIRDIDGKHGDLGHNAGNDAVFACAGFLALNSLTKAQIGQYRAGQRITPALGFSFVGYTLDRVNVRPGTAATQSQKSARPPSQRNDNRQQPTLSAKFQKAMSLADAAAHEESEYDSGSDSDKIFSSDMVPYTGGGGRGF